MISLLTRVNRASVVVEGASIAAIGKGILVLVGVERQDSQTEARRLAERLLGFRVFEDADGRMNLNVSAVGGQVLLVPQFTLAADTSRGHRPGFEPAAPPEQALVLFQELTEAARRLGAAVETGRFGAHMEVESVNSGPATFLIRVRPDSGRSALQT